MKRRKKNRFYTIIIGFLLLDLIVIVILFNVSNARYESNAVSSTELDVALFALDENTDLYISLDTMIPRDDPYVYRFSITNTTKSGLLTDVKMNYNLRIIATTNLPLEYKLYKNQNYLSPTAANIITADDVIPDDDGTFFRTMATPQETFGFSEVETNQYTLLVYFPSRYKDSKYQDMIESIQINVGAEQKVDGI